MFLPESCSATMYNMLTLYVLVVMPFMGLSGLWPLLVHCQLFGAPSMPFHNYVQSPLSGLFSLLGFGNYPPMHPNAGAYPPPFPPYPRSDAPYPRSDAPYPRSDAPYPRSDPPYPRSDPPFYQPPPPPAPPVEYSSRYMPPPPMPYSAYSSNNVVLPKLPTKYDIGIFKSAPNVDKSNYPNSYYSYKYEPYPIDPMVYPTKPLQDKSGSYYRSVYPKSPYGNYRELLKALLNGPPSAYMPSYSQNVPSIKNIFEGDYASITGKSPAEVYLEKPEFSYPTELPVSEQKVMYPVQAPAEKPVGQDIREMYGKQFPDLVAYQKPLPSALAQKPTFVYTAEPDRMQALLSTQTTNPYALAGLSSPYAEKKPVQQQEGPMFYQEKMAGYPDMKTFYQLPNMVEKKPMSYDQLPSITLKIPYQTEQQQQRMAPGSGYDLYPVFNNVGLKQPNAYQSPTVLPPGQDITYETDNIPSKPANYPTYFTATKQAEYKRDPGNVQEKKSPPSMDESYAPAKYPTLGYEMDREQRKPVPAIIAALFGGGKLGKSIDMNSGEQYAPKNNYETPPVKQGYFSAPVTGYEENPGVKQMVTGQSSGRYSQSTANNSPVDIFIPIGRTSKHTGTDPIKTIMH